MGWGEGVRKQGGIELKLDWLALGNVNTCGMAGKSEQLAGDFISGGSC